MPNLPRIFHAFLCRASLRTVGFALFSCILVSSGNALAHESAPGGTDFCASLLTKFKVQVHRERSAVISDPLLEEMRANVIVDDFKTLADLVPRRLTPLERVNIIKQSNAIERARGRRAALEFLKSQMYEEKDELRPAELRMLRPHWQAESQTHGATFAYIERMWPHLTKQTPRRTESTLLPMPFPIMVPGARFREGYYWDTFFVMPALLDTGRSGLVKLLINNFLFQIQEYGFVPNGTRDYYLSRSQPPLLSQMIRIYLENKIATSGRLSKHTLAWLKHKAYPLVKKDYLSFWMNPTTRYDRAAQLNHYFADLAAPRPERYSSDRDDLLAATFIDLGAELESGKDFTGAFDGVASQYAGVMLNSLLYQVERNLAWMASLLNNSRDVWRFNRAAAIRAEAIHKYLWDKADDSFRDYNLRTGQFSSILTADTFIPLYVGVASPAEAAKIISSALPRLECIGGLAASDVETGKQWDKPNGWAPQHYFAISGARRYGYNSIARRLAIKWLESNDQVFRRTGKLYEKIDVTTGGLPVDDGRKYPTQEGFLWTNGVYVWALHNVLGVPLRP